MVLNKNKDGILWSALLFYINLWRGLKLRVFKRNKYYSYTANNIVKGKNMIVIRHLDDLNISHAEAAEVTKLAGYLKEIYCELQVLDSKTH